MLPMNPFSLRHAVAGLAVAGAFALCAAADTPPAEAAFDGAFFPMFQTSKVSDPFLVERPGQPAEPGVPGKAYPFGTRVTLGDKDAKVHVFLAPNRQIHLLGADIVIGDDPETPGAKRAELFRGAVETFLGQDEDAPFPFSIATPAAVFDDFRGRTAVFAQDGGADWKAGVRVSSGKVTMRAPQILPSRLGNSTHLAVESRKDGSYTCVNGIGGDYALCLENGSDPAYEAAFHPGSVAKIWRSRAPKSGLLAVNILVLNGDGSLLESYAFNEGQPPVKGGLAARAEAPAEESEEASDAETPAEPDAGLSNFDEDFSAPTTDDDTWNF